MPERTDVGGYKVRHRDFDLRHDLHNLVAYMRQHQVKRRTRDNNLPKNDVKRLAKRLSYPHIQDEYEADGFSPWLNFVDLHCLALGFLDYDLKGDYRGYSSVEPSFPENYVTVREAVHDKFIQQTLIQQERILLDFLVAPYDHSRNEFFSLSPVGWLDSFSLFGSAVGILPHIDFAKARWFLLEQLGQLEPGAWYDTASWVAELKRDHPYFLIPEKPQREVRNPHEFFRRAQMTARGKKKGKKDSKPPEPQYEAVPRYASLYEKYYTTRDDVIPEDAPDGFERVEGRYIERFLEYIPFVLGYVDLAYAADYEARLYRRVYTPDDEVSRDVIKAFRVTPLLRQVLQRALPAPTVTIQPNFEVVVESSVYPAQTLRSLGRLGTVSHKGQTSSVLLDKKAVAAAVAADETLDVLALLRQYAQRDLPQNILIELQEWVQRSDVFTLYENVHLVEDQVGLPLVKDYAIQHIHKHLYLVPDHKQIGEQLRQRQQAVLVIEHPPDGFADIPEGTQTALPQAPAKPEPEAVSVQMEQYITLRFPNREAMAAVQQGLLDARCPLTINEEVQTLTFPAHQRDTLQRVIASLAERYQINLQAT